MNKSEIFAAMNDGTVSFSNAEIISLVKTALTKEEKVDYPRIREVIDGLNKVRKIAKEGYEKLAKDLAAASKEEQAQYGSNYLANTPKGTTVTYRMADGSKKFGIFLGITESGKSAHISLDKQFVEEGKKADRYVAFDKIEVPAEYLKKLAELADSQVA